MSLLAVIIICAVVLVMFMVSLITKGMGFILDILTTPKKLITLLAAIAILFVIAAFVSNM